MTTDIQNYLSDFDQLQTNDWFAKNRKTALNLFKETGFPNTRQENWKYTDVRPIARKSFSNINDQKTTVSPDNVNAIRFSDLDCIELVFINGIYSAEHSHINELPANVVVENLADVLVTDNKLLEKHLSQYADNKISPFTALNTAFIQHGTYINVPDNVVIERPINLLFLSKENPSPFATHPRNLIIMGNHAQATIIESYIGLDEANYFTNAVT